MNKTTYDCVNNTQFNLGTKADKYYTTLVKQKCHNNIITYGLKRIYKSMNEYIFLLFVLFNLQFGGNFK